MSRPILLGMNNPLSRRPEHALYPHPVNCTGWRLWRMLHARTGASKAQYLAAFDRRNLLNAQKWSMEDARLAACNWEYDLHQGGGPPSGTVVVVLGAEPAGALRLPRLLVLPQERGGVTYRQLPHPSGRNLWYNDPDHRAVAELLLEELYEQHVGRAPGPGPQD